MNENKVWTYRFSNPDTERLFRDGCVDDTRRWYNCFSGLQCGGCSFFAKFNADYGLCCNRKSAHFTETVFEHFTCPAYVLEGWGPHSFTEDASMHCRCGRSPPDEQRPTTPPEIEKRLERERRRRRRKRRRR